MTGPEHYREAERLLQPRTVHSVPSGEPRQAAPTTDMILQAQVHATLALAAATAELDAYGMADGSATGRTNERAKAWTSALMHGPATGGASDG